MTVALIPVKSLSAGKSRLAGVLHPGERRSLIISMLEKVLAGCFACDSLSRVVVITADRDVADLARSAGAFILSEPSGGGLNNAFAAGITHARATGAARALLLPADIPSITPHEIQLLLIAMNGHRRSVIVPCHKQQGTNALLFPSDAAFVPQFGMGSFWRHYAQLAAIDLKPRALHLPGIAEDIDEPDDLRRLAFRQDPSSFDNEWSQGRIVCSES